MIDASHPTCQNDPLRRPRHGPTTRLPTASTPAVKVVSLWRKRFLTDRLAGLEERDRPGRPPTFPPELVVQVKALACELPAKYDLPFALEHPRSGSASPTQRPGGVPSGSTLWRWLQEGAIRPWYHRSWIFPRDPQFATKAGRVLDLYASQWKARP